jgi:hypothetical protein
LGGRTQQVITDSGRNVNKKTFWATFLQVDSDNNGKIDMEEFVGVLDRLSAATEDSKRASGRERDSRVTNLLSSCVARAEQMARALCKCSEHSIGSCTILALCRAVLDW